MEKKEEGIMIICSPVNHLKIKGQEVSCSDCGTTVYLSDSSLNSVRQNTGKSPDDLTLKIVCLECGLKHVKEDEVNVFPVTEEQIKEIKKVIE